MRAPGLAGVASHQPQVSDQTIASRISCVTTMIVVFSSSRATSAISAHAARLLPDRGRRTARPSGGYVCPHSSCCRSPALPLAAGQLARPRVRAVGESEARQQRARLRLRPTASGSRARGDARTAGRLGTRRRRGPRARVRLDLHRARRRPRPSPASTRRSVVLPTPDGPSTPTGTWPLVRESSRNDVANLRADVAQDEVVARVALTDRSKRACPCRSHSAPRVRNNTRRSHAIA